MVKIAAMHNVTIWRNNLVKLLIITLPFVVSEIKVSTLKMV